MFQYIHVQLEATSCPSKRWRTVSRAPPLLRSSRARLTTLLLLNPSARAWTMGSRHTTRSTRGFSRPRSPRTIHTNSTCMRTCRPSRRLWATFLPCITRTLSRCLNSCSTTRTTRTRVKPASRRRSRTCVCLTCSHHSSMRRTPPRLTRSGAPMERGAPPLRRAWPPMARPVWAPRLAATSRTTRAPCSSTSLVWSGTPMAISC